MPKVKKLDTPLSVVRVGKWWGVFVTPPLDDDDGPEVRSWHVSQEAAERACADSAPFDPSGYYDPDYDRTARLRIKGRKDVE